MFLNSFIFSTPPVIANSDVPEIWLGGPIWCNASPQDCVVMGMDFIREGRYPRVWVQVLQCHITPASLPPLTLPLD